MKGSKLSALLGAIACALPTAAIAQTSSADDAYLNDLYSFLQSEDTIPYTIAYVTATQFMTPEDSILVAQTFCQTFASGVSPAAAYSVYIDAAISGASSYGEYFTEDVAYAIGLYSGAMMDLGAAYYCPEYQPQVEEALRSL